MSNTNQDGNHKNQARRKLLKSLAAGGGVVATGKAALPESWIKPVVDSVLLPAHAQTSLVLGRIFASATIPAGGNASILDVLVSSAYADHQIYQICATENGSSATVTLQNIVDNQVRRQGTIPLSGTPGSMEVVQSCKTPGQQSVPGRITNVSDTSLTFVLNRPGEAGDLVAVLPRVGSCPSFPPTNGCNGPR